MDTVANGTMTSRGRITIPKEIRDYLRLRAGRRVELQVDRHGQVIMRAGKIDSRRDQGVARGRGRPPHFR